MTVAEFIADFLYNLQVRNIFLLSGTGSVVLDDALAKKQGMKYVCARHEATAVVMAEAVAKLKNNIGVAVVTTGPGGTNAIPGVVEAWVDTVPVLVISGQVEQNQINKDRAFGLQGFNIIDNVKNITKYCALVDDPNSIRYHLERAVHEATSGRPGPVWLDIPMDMQAAEIDVEEMKGFTPPTQETKCDVSDIVNALKKSKRPLVAFGRGIKNSGTKKELLTLLRELEIPSVSARMANDIIPYNDKNYFGMGGIRGRRCATRIMKESDLLLTLGTSIGLTFIGQEHSCLANDCKVAAVNIDKQLFERDDIQIDVSLCADLKEFFNGMKEYTSSIKTNNSYVGWLEHCHKIKSEHVMVTEEMKGDPINSYNLIECLSKLTNSRHIFTNDAGSSNYISSQAMNLNNGQRELTSGAFYTMGLTLPLAIGAASLEPSSQIIAVTGDGSIELNIQELQTINLHSFNIKIFVINNGGYASIRASQDAMCGGRYTDDEQILNFKKVADTFNLEFEIIETASELETKIRKVLENDKPTLVEVVCDSNQYMIQPLKELV